MKGSELSLLCEKGKRSMAKGLCPSGGGLTTNRGFISVAPKVARDEGEPANGRSCEGREASLSQPTVL